MEPEVCGLNHWFIINTWQRNVAFLVLIKIKQVFMCRGPSFGASHLIFVGAFRCSIVAALYQEVYL